MTHFDERSGVVPALTPWGSWYQTIEEVVVLVNVAAGTRGRDGKTIVCKVSGKAVIQGNLFGGIVTDDSTWTIEDGTLLRIVLQKQQRTAGNTWRSLLEDMYKVDAQVFDDMEKKMTLERFQRENPGFDFSGADLTGNYHGGGPQMDKQG